MILYLDMSSRLRSVTASSYIPTTVDILLRKTENRPKDCKKNKVSIFLASVAQKFLSVRFEAVCKDSRRQVCLCHPERFFHLFLNYS